MAAMYSYFQGIGCNSQQCVEKLTLLQQLKEAMRSDIVKFIFEKKDGEIRTAFGTRATDVLNHNNAVPQGSRNNTTTFPYFDIEKKAWRCFKPEFLREICSDYTI